jgi:hypothetical protein
MMPVSAAEFKFSTWFNSGDDYRTAAAVVRRNPLADESFRRDDMR